MSAHDDIPPLDDELRAYVASHRTTGEPPAGAVARVRAQLRAPTSADPARPARRRLPLAPELLAVAALVIALLAARSLVRALRPDDTAPPERGPQVQAVIDAYRVGDLGGAQRLASQHCTEPACAGVQTLLTKIANLSGRLDALSDQDLRELRDADATLSGGVDSVLAKKIAARGPSTPQAPPGQMLVAMPADALFRRAEEARKAKRYEDAISLLQACLRTDPAFHPCQRQLGSAWAGLAARDTSAAAQEEARRAYERYLEIAPADDEYAPKVRAILDAVRDERPVAARSAVSDEVRRRAQDVYLRGYQLKDVAPDDAARLFREVVEMLPADDELAQKARRRLEELERP